MSISLHSLRYFTVLAEELHYGAAARRLSISPPSLSQQITRLEASVGVALFDRSPRRVTLTPAGTQLLPLARRVGDAEDDVQAWVRAHRESPAEVVLRIGIVAAGAGPLTTSILVAAVARIPGLRLELRRLGFFDSETELRSGRVDLAFAPGPLDNLSPDVRVSRVWEEPRVLVVPRNHRLAGKSSVSISETADEVFVIASGGRPETIDWWLVDPRRDGSHPRRGPVADDVDGLLELVAAGAGVNIAAASAAHHYRRDELVFVPIDDIDPASIALLVRNDATNPHVATLERIATEMR